MSCELAEGPCVLPVEDPSSFHAQMELSSWSSPRRLRLWSPGLEWPLSGLARPRGRQRSWVPGPVEVRCRGGRAGDAVTQAWVQTWLCQMLPWDLGPVS